MAAQKGHTNSGSSDFRFRFLFNIFNAPIKNVCRIRAYGNPSTGCLQPCCLCKSCVLSQKSDTCSVFPSCAWSRSRVVPVVKPFDAPRFSEAARVPAAQSASVIFCIAHSLSLSSSSPRFFSFYPPGYHFFLHSLSSTFSFALITSSSLLLHLFHVPDLASAPLYCSVLHCTLSTNQMVLSPENKMCQNLLP